MKLSPQFKLAAGLVMLLLSTALIGDALGLLPRPEDRLRDARKIVSETLAVQLSEAAARSDEKLIATTLRSLVARNDEVLFGELTLASGKTIAAFGTPPSRDEGVFHLSTLDNLVVPIFRQQAPWGSVRLQFAPSNDWGLRYLGFPSSSLVFIGFLGLASLISFWLFLRRALTELSPTKAVPERINAAFEVLAEGVLILDESQRIVLANASFARRIGSSPDQLIGKSPDDQNWDLNGEDAQRYPWQIAMETGEQAMDVHMKLTVDGSVVSFTVNAAPILDAADRTRGVLITFDDVSSLETKNTELARMLSELNETQQIIETKNRELEVLATRDGLTGVLNRRTFLNASAGYFELARRSDAPLSALMVDIDHFKSVNDNYGHLVGDKAIKAVADALGAFFRKSDSVGRYGGEEFVVVLPDTSADEALVTAERLRQHVATLVDSEDLPMERMTISIGLAQLDSTVADLTELIDRADRGLYKAKQTGRNQVCLFDPHYTPAAVPGDKENPASDSASSIDRDPSTQETLQQELASMQQRIREQADEIAYRSMYDTVTRLPNQLLLADRIDQALKQSKRSEQPGAVISIALTGYQNIAELGGNAASDAFIQEAARRIQGIIRNGDSITALSQSEGLTCSRVAHNELAILAVNLEDVHAAARVAERVIETLEAPISVGAHKILSRVYCGIALFPMDGDEAQLLMRNATLARKFAERRSPSHSGNAFFSSEIDALAVKSAQIAAGLHDALAHGAIKIAYQPKVDAATREIIGVEALARWHSDALGHVSPQAFVEVAEHLGMVHMLTDYVLGQVCRDIAEGRLGGVRVSINVSPLELGDAATTQRLLGILADHGIPASRIGVEITESSFLNNEDVGRAVLESLRDAGILVSLDDFGTGYSSLNMLCDMPVDIIKIDRSFIDRVQESPAKLSIVQSILALARALEMRVVAEGVSSNEEYHCLTRMGCTEMQGFLFARPMHTDALAEAIAQVGSRHHIELRSSTSARQKSA